MKFPITNISKNKFISYPPNSNKCACCEETIKDDDFICLGVTSGSNRGDLLMDVSIHMESRHIYGGLSVLSLEKTEHIEIYVCSPKCLRGFFNSICDEVEKNFPEYQRNKKLNDIGI